MYKKPLMPLKLIAPTGLLLLSASFFIKHFIAIADFADGLLKGIGIGMILFSLINQWHMKNTGE